jgi:hypothetical protein
LQANLEAAGKSLDAWQFLALVHAAGKDKITQFENDALAEAPIAVPSRGSSRLARTVSTALDRQMLEQILLDGFFAKTGIDDLPREGRRTGLQEFGLPYASDPVISKHLARFLRCSLQNVTASEKLASLVGPRTGTDALIPTAVLFNGGVFKAAPIRARVLELLASWNAGQPVRELQGFEPDLAVARGAMIYGRQRATGRGMRIKAGTSRSYYIGLETSALAVPGFRPPVKALCVVPQGMQEGTELLIEGRELGLVTGRPAEFRFFCSASRKNDPPGALIEDFGDDLEELSPVEVRLTSDRDTAEVVPVSFETVITETGMLQLWCVAHDGRRWKLEFSVRETVA